MRLKELLANVREWSAQPDEPDHKGCTDLAWDCAADLAQRLKLAMEALEKIKHPLYSCSTGKDACMVRAQNDQLVATEALKEIDEPPTK